MAGARAHNRRLADFVSAHPERHCGVALLPVTAPVDRVVAEVHRAKESGLGALMIPAMWVDKEPYHDRRYDPVRAAAAECKAGPALAGIAEPLREPPPDATSPVFARGPRSGSGDVGTALTGAGVRSSVS